MKYERPIILVTYKVEELLKDAAVCCRYGTDGVENKPFKFGNRG